MLAETDYIKLSDLAWIIDDLVKEAFCNRTYWIVAETADVKNYPDRQYCFVTLIEKEGKDTLARMEAVLWSRYYSEIENFERITGKRFEKNIRILLKVIIDFSPVYGLKLQILAIDPSYTLGELERTKQQTLDRLVAENPQIIQYQDGIYQTKNKLLSRPLAFQRIALITAPDSDGRRDFLHELQSNPYGYSFQYKEYLTRIQGEGAEKQILECLHQVKASEHSYDAVIITRGGGSQLDFGPFDTYELGLAIATFPVPVITGIGHERNVSIADHMSHLQVKTPTKAAAFLIDHNHKFEEDIISMTEYIFRFASETISDEDSRLDRASEKLSFSVKTFLSNRSIDLDKVSIALKHLDPENVLARGFAMIKKDRQILTDPEKIKQGDVLEIRLKESVILSEVIRITLKNEK
ncbi:MAG: exodeoxyribonuclease VII large subunit [Bacteroidales bacterium]